jgi:hypothetical protein
MPLIITEGYGSLEGSGFSVPTLLPSPNYLDIQFTDPLAPLILQAASVEFWRFATTSEIKIVPTSVEIVGGNTVRIHHSEGHAGDIHTIYFPANGLASLGGAIYDGFDSALFTAAGAPPNFTILQSVDVRTVRVIFNEAVTDEALVATNYSITPTLRVFSVARVDARTYLLTTDTQVPGTTYTLTVINVRDGSGNIV